jgi:hypothetical protein
MNVENTSVKAQPLFFIKESIMGRKLTDVLGGRKAFSKSPNHVQLKSSHWRKPLQSS